MTKEQFFKFCRTHDATEGVRLKIAQRREYRGMDNILVLDGCWAGCSILERELYRPTPGQQGQERHNYYRDANEKLDVAQKKFQRWLDEFNQQAASLETAK